MSLNIQKLLKLAQILNKNEIYVLFESKFRLDKSKI